MQYSESFQRNVLLFTCVTTAQSITLIAYNRKVFPFPSCVLLTCISTHSWVWQKGRLPPLHYLVFNVSFSVWANAYPYPPIFQPVSLSGCSKCFTLRVWLTLEQMAMFLGIAIPFFLFSLPYSGRKPHFESVRQYFLRGHCHERVTLYPPSRSFFCHSLGIVSPKLFSSERISVYLILNSKHSRFWGTCNAVTGSRLAVPVNRFTGHSDCNATEK